MTTPELAAVLSDIAPFDGLEREQREQVAHWLEAVTIAAGQPVVLQGGSDRDLYICIDGEAAVSRGGVEVERIGRGAWFGELALILGTRRAASIVAKTPLRLARLSRAAYLALAREQPALALRLLEVLLDSVAVRLGVMSDSVGELLRAQAWPRRAQVLVRIQGAAARAVPNGTRVGELLPAEVAGLPVVAALSDRKPISLRTAITSNCELEALTTSHWEGQRIYHQSLALLFHDALHAVRARIDPKTQSVGEVVLAHSVGFARRAHVRGHGDWPLEDLARRIEDEMRALAARDLPLLEELWSVEEAKEYFERAGAARTVALFGCWRQDAVPVCAYGGNYVLRMGPLVARSSVLQGFGVVADNEGLLLMYGSQGLRSLTPGVQSQPPPASVQPDAQTLAAYEARRVSLQTATLMGASEPWQRALGIDSIGAYNRACIEGSVPRLIRVNEGFHEKALGRIADQIVERGRTTRIVCIAGPSSSGKTTFIERLKVQLHVNGKNPIGISLDDYYCDRDRTPRDDAGELDYEALHALDLPLLNTDLARLLRRERVRTARYDFTTGTSHPAGGSEITLGKDDLLLIEGIHALNPAILDEADRSSAFLIFVSPLGHLPIDEISRVHGSDLRLLRRIVRDRHTRATAAEANILRWPSVRRGERTHIFPFQHRADAVFDSGLLYELSVLKVFAERYLLEVPQTSPAYPTAFRLLALLDQLVTIYPDHVPQTSILREFIGRSGYEY